MSESHTGIKDAPSQGKESFFTLWFVAAVPSPAQGSVVGRFLQGEGAHHRLTEKLGSTDLLLPVLLQGRRWLLRLHLLLQFESYNG